MALGPREGLVEWVTDATPLADLNSISAEQKQEQHENSGGDGRANPLCAFLRKHAPCDSGPFGIRADVVETFVRSCAAYSVLTFVLGVGDRHLDNLLLRKNGAFMHVDFGYCFGRDPKPQPFVSPVRFTREMLYALGGPDSPHFERCMLCAVSVYQALRKDASLLLNLLWLMGNANIADLSVAQEPTRAIRAVHQRLRLNLTEREADIFIRTRIERGFHAVLPGVMETVHRIATSFQS